MNYKQNCRREKIPSLTASIAPSLHYCVCPSPKHSHRHFDDGEGASTDGHRPQQCRSDTPPEASQTVGLPGAGKTMSHRPIPLIGPKPVGLHLALDYIEGIRCQPECLTGDAAVQGHQRCRDIRSVNLLSARMRVHEILKRQKPDPVCLCLPQHRHRLTAIEAREDTSASGRDLSNAIKWTRVQLCLSVGLSLESDTDVLDRARQDRVCNPGERSGKIVLRVRQRRRC